MDTTTTDPTPAPADDSTLALLAARGALRVPDEEQSFCEWKLSDPDAPGEVVAAIRDATQGGDLYVLCATLDPNAEPRAAELSAPSGATWSLDLEVDDDYEVARSSYGGSRGVIGRSADGRRHYVGLIEHSANYVTQEQPDSGPTSKILQVMVWLPHERPAGVWSFRFDLGVTGLVAGTIAIDRPCATAGGHSAGRPFVLPAGLRLTGYEAFGGRQDVLPSENCRVVPNFIGLDLETAQAIATAHVARLNLGGTVMLTSGVCHAAGDVATVTDQYPEPHEYQGSRADIRLDHTVDCSEGTATADR